ncbi:MAG: hypothetical protein R3B09_15720 [Nannocystaceae bacterium]
MKRTIVMMMLAAAPLALGACSGDAKTDKPTGDKPAGDKPEGDKPDAEPEAEKPLDPDVAKAVAIADAIVKDPANADAILEKNGLDRDKLDAMMSDIAKDPAKAEAYKLARAE